MYWLYYRYYPVHGNVAVRSTDPTLISFLDKAAGGRRMTSHYDDAYHFHDPRCVHLQMLPVAHHYHLPDLTKYCLGQIEEYVRGKPAFVWEIHDFRAKHPSCTGDLELELMSSKVFAVNAKGFVTDERFERVVKKGGNLAWAVVCHMAKKMK